MFLATLSSHADARTLQSRGATRYIELYSKLLGPKLVCSTHELGPLTLMSLAGTRHDKPIMVASEHQTVSVVGHPSCLASSGTSVVQFIQDRLRGHIGTDDLVKELQGDFVALVVDHVTGRWEAAVDSVGLGRLYVLPVRNGLILSDSLYLLAASKPLELDPVGCYTLDLSGYLFGNRTIFKGVDLVEMDQKVGGGTESWTLDRRWHFIDAKGPDCDAEELAAAYEDAARPRFAAADEIRHCSSGGTDSRVTLALMTRVGRSPSVFCWRWDKDDTRISQELANELGLDFQSTSRTNYLGPSGDAQGSVLAEALLLDGGLKGAFTKRSYLFDLHPSDLLTTGNYGESTIKSIWGIGYAGMVFPKGEKIIDRLIAFSLIRNNYDRRTFASESAGSQVKEYLRSVLEEQAKIVSGVDCVKLCNYFYLRNRGARWAAQSLAAANRVARVDYPLAYAAGVAASWRVPSRLYKNLRLARELLFKLEPRLARYPFADGSPAAPDFGLRATMSVLANRKVKKGFSAAKTRLLGMPTTKSQGNLRPQSLRADELHLWQRWPSWATDVVEQRSGHIYRPVNQEPEHLSYLTRAGHLHCINTLEFASRVYDGEF